MVLKCKMCGGDVQVIDDTAYGTCDSCGVMSTLPRVNDEKTVNLFNRANHFRRLHEFDRALAAYESILNEDNTNAEAHWCAALCRYGIEYVEDPKTHERVPTCHRVQYESILADPDYLSALEFSPDEQTRILYEEEANRISDIQKDILAISNNEAPYDIFICYKETTDSGSRTKDSTIAQDIYYQLSNDGYRVFFSKITLEEKLGQQYEPYIFSALNSAKVMLVIGTSKEHFEAVWVKNEWSRFISIMKKDRNRLLIPCYIDMDAYDMPDELSNFQSQDMSKVGFMQDLTRGIKKVLDGFGSTELSAISASEIVHKSASSEMDSLLLRAYMFIEDGDFNKATEYFDKVLDREPENASAYWGLLMSKRNCRTEEQLCNYLIEHDNEYKKALRFADAEQSSRYQSIAGMFRQSINQKFDDSSESAGTTIINGGFALWDFIKPINSSEYFKTTGGDNPIEWLVDIIPSDINPVVKCSNAKVVIIKNGSIALMDILPALEKIVQNESSGIIVVCEPCDQELLRTLLINSNRGVLKTLFFLLQGGTENQLRLVSDISNMTGARIFDSPEAVKNISDDDFGIVSEICACGDRAMFVASRERLEQLKENERRLEEKRRQEEQRLCRYCGGTLGFFKKCKSCGRKN